MNKKIKEYLFNNRVITLATCDNGQPYCANCFYVFDEENQCLIFLSDLTTRHIKESLKNKSVAGTVNSVITTVAKIQGIQFMGEFIHPNETQQKKFYTLYYKNFPFAKAKPTPIWGIALTSIKMTDNTLGFGKKLLWERGEGCKLRTKNLP